MDPTAIERLLPAVFQVPSAEGSPLAALLYVMCKLHEPAEQALDEVDTLFSPYRARAEFVTFLARWVAVDHLIPTPGEAAGTDPITVSRLRDLVAEGAMLARWRGTVRGMQMALRVATGVTGFDIEEPPERPFHFVVRVPAAAAGQIPLITRLVAAEKPAATTSEIVVAEPAVEETP